MIGIYIGRFQPFHYGHLHALLYAWDRSDHLHVAISSKGDKSLDSDNPFTFHEREKMIKGMLNKMRIKGVDVFHITDRDTDKEWVEQVRSFLPKESFRVFTNNETVKNAFDKNMEVSPLILEIPMIRSDIYSGTNIRLKMLRNEGWETLCPLETIKVIKSSK